LILALLPNLAIVVLGIASIILVRGESGDENRNRVKRAIIIASTGLIVLAIANIFHHSTERYIYFMIEIYTRSILAVFWFFLAYKAIYEEIKKEARRREKELEALNNVALAVGQSMDIQQILRNALQSVTKIGNFEFGFIYLLNKKKGVLELATVYGNIPEDVAESSAVLQLGQGV